MTQQQCALIAFIKSALTDQACVLPEDYDLTAVFQTAMRHGVDGMVYYGALRCGVNKNNEIMREELMRVYQDISVSETQLAEIQRITDAFEAHGIKHMPLKGALLKKLYPHTEMRRMGDVDILIDCAQYETTRGIMKALGYIEKYESDHELVWENRPVNIELHKRLIPSYNKDYYQYYGDGWKLAKPMDGYSCRYNMTACDEMIYLFTHFAKHYRDAGIGIRHIVDLWVYRKHNPDLDEGYIRKELKKLQLLEFYDNIVRTLGVWFEDAPADERTEYITQFILTSGEYGRAHNSNLSSALKLSKSSGSEQEVKRKQVIRALLPGYTEMSRRYKVLKKVPVLLPVMWVVRLFEKVFQKGKVQYFVSSKLNVDADEVSQYQQSLNYVGLDFNFSE